MQGLALWSSCADSGSPSGPVTSRDGSHAETSANSAAVIAVLERLNRIVGNASFGFARRLSQRDTPLRALALELCVAVFQRVCLCRDPDGAAILPIGSGVNVDCFCHIVYDESWRSTDWTGRAANV